MISLYTATVPAFLQVIAATRGVIAKGEAFAAKRGIDPATLIDSRLAPDMLPFGYQVKSVAVHSAGAIEAVRSGSFSPDRSPWPTDFAALTGLIDAAAATLTALDPAAVDGLAGGEMAFVFGERRVPYHAEDFLLSFSLPNFYFHATVAYAILRAQGVALGKRDYIGMPRIKA